MKRVPYLKNLSALSVSKIEVLKAKSLDYAQFNSDKAAYKTWCTDPATDHVFLSPCSGVRSDFRVGTRNGAAFMHAVIIDYDATIPGDIVERVDDYFPRQRPTYIARTFSGNWRAVWVLSEPFRLSSSEDFRQTVRALRRQWKLDHLGIDKRVDRATQVYELGNIIWKGEECPVSAVLDATRAATSAKIKSQGASAGRPHLSWAAIERLVRSRGWLSRWTSGFHDGARGVRFWDSSASDPTGAVMRPDGMQTFSGDNPGFLTWSDIFGPEAVKGEVGESAVGVINSSFRIGSTKVFMLRSDGSSVIYPTPGDFEAALHHIYGFPLPSRGSKKRDDTPDTKSILASVTEHNQLDGVWRNKAFKSQVICYGGLRVLNSEQFSPTLLPQISDRVTEEQIPTFLEWFKLAFDRVSMHTVLTWMSHVAVDVYLGVEPTNFRFSPALYVVGDVELGKSLVFKELFGERGMGGTTSLTHFFQAGQVFTAPLYSNVIWVADDMDRMDSRERGLFSSMVKRLVGWHVGPWNEKHQPKVEPFPVYGRIVVLANRDRHSLAILPEAGMSMDDKAIMVEVQSRVKPWISRRTNVSKLMEELPEFISYLVHTYNPPEELLATGRMSQVLTQSSHLQKMAFDSSTVGNICRCIGAALMARFDDWPEDPNRLWNAVELLEYIRSGGGSDLLHNVTALQLEHALATASKIPAYNGLIEDTELNHRVRGALYKINKNAWHAAYLAGSAPATSSTPETVLPETVKG